MNEIIDQNAIENLYMLFVFATALAFFWILESVWANDKRWLPAIIILPATILIFILNYWEETRFRCFIASLLFFIIFVISGLVGYDFLAEISKLLFKVLFWPYYTYKFFITSV